MKRQKKKKKARNKKQTKKPQKTTMEKTNTTSWEKIFSHNISDTGLVSKMYKEFLNNAPHTHTKWATNLDTLLKMYNDK